MNNTSKRQPCRAVTALLLPLSLGATANEGESLPDATFSAELGAGYEYDSNVSIDELDASSNESDYAWLAELELAVEKPLSESAELNLSYDFSQNWYQEFSEVNRQTHLLGADLSWDLDAVTTGAYAYYIRARLDGRSFLEQFRASPYISGFMGKKWYARGAYVYIDKTIENRPQRNATAHSAEGDLYYFQRGLRSYFNFGYRYKQEDAVAAQFSYRASSLKLRYVRRLSIAGRLSSLELAWRFEDRDYTGIEPTINEKRADDRHRWGAELEIPLTKNFEWVIYAGYSDYDSNLPRAEYDREVYGTQLSYSW